MNVYKEFNDSNKKIVQLQKKIDELTIIKNENNYLIEDLKNENEILIKENNKLKEDNNNLKKEIAVNSTNNIILNLIKIWLGEEVFGFLELAAIKAKKDIKQIQEDKKI